MKKIITLLTILFITTAMAQAPTGRDVNVRWTPPDNFDSVPYTGYRIYYTDSTGTGHAIDVPDPTATEYLVPNVPWGPSTWVMTSLCPSCEIQQESDPSPQISKNIQSREIPLAPGSIDIDFTQPNASLEPGKYPFQADVAGITYAGDCNLKVKKHFDLKCKGKPL